MKGFRACLLALTLLGAPAAAVADGVAVLGYRSAEAPSSAAAPRDAIARVIAASGRAAITDPFTRARARLDAGAVPRERLREFRRAEEVLDEGWRAYLAVNRAFAASRLAEARRIAEAVVDLPGGPALLGEISLRLGVVMMDLGQVDRAGELFRMAAILDPERVVTMAELPPDVVAARAAALAETPARAAVTITVPGGGLIEIDGVAAGSSPVAAELTVGQHLVVARSPGRKGRGAVVEVRPGGAEAISFELDPDPLSRALRQGLAALALGRPEGEAAVVTEALAIYGEIDAVVLVASVWRHGAPALLGQLCDGAPMRCGPVTELGYAEPEQLAAAARELWAALRRRGTARGFPPTLLVDQRLVKGEPAPGTSGPIEPARRWWDRPVLWIGAATVLVGVGAAVLLGGDDEVTPMVNGRPCDFITCP